MHDRCIVCTVHWEPDEQKIQFLMNIALTLSLTIAIPTLLALRNGRFFGFKADLVGISGPTVLVHTLCILVYMSNNGC